MRVTSFSIGAGEHGEAVKTASNEADAEKKLYDVNGFNAYVSDKISLDRAIPDFRFDEYADHFTIQWMLSFMWAFL